MKMARLIITFYSNRIVDMSRNAEKFGTRVFWSAKACEPAESAYHELASS